MDRGLPLALTMGDPAGIGPEIAAKAWTALHREEPCFLLVGDPAVMSPWVDGIPGFRTATIVAPEEAAGIFADALPVLPMPTAVPVTPGQTDPANAPAVVGSIETAVALTRDGRAAGVVTNPIHKATLYDAGFPHPGHTEYLAELAGVPRTVMMLIGADLRVVPVTIHMALQEVPRRLDTAAIVDTGVIVAEALRHRFAIARPRLAVAGLNPHAGEDGRMGTEDRDIVAPAVARLRDLVIDATGPLPADTMFHARARAGYDAALCMYHDQAMIPAKTLDFDGGINVTLGLPFVRTSPDHGTALDIAGRGIARPDSLIAAIRTASTMAATHPPESPRQP